MEFEEDESPRVFNDDIETQMEGLFASDDEPFQDSGSEYQPSRNTSPESLNLLELLENENLASNDEVPNAPAQERDENEQQKSRKRKRNEKKWKKYVRKTKRNKGEQYLNTKGNIVPAKQVRAGEPCICNAQCHTKINPDCQNELFKKFYELTSFDLQTSYLFSLIKVAPKNKSTLEESRRSNSRIYYIPNSDGILTKVCKSFFKKIFQVSDGRITRLLKQKLTVPTPPQDQRGKHPPKNKTSNEQLQSVKEFINKFPRYTSHYTLHKSQNRQFLCPDLNINKMYSLYCSETTTPVSDYIFRKIFNEHFNLSFHAPISDSCKKCDSMEIKIKASMSEEEKDKFRTQKKLHLTKAQSAKDNYQEDKNFAKENNDVTVLVFDLMKTLPTPVISTGLCYYKRQLWTYCLGIHDAATDNVTMCVWNETIASRGPQEIGSCLIKYIKENVKTKNLILYSDQCGGQNRNIKMATLCQYIVANPDFTVETIDHKFFVSGHSYLACDQDFGLIEKKKKLFPNIYIPDDWLQVIRAARNRNPFNIISMKKEDFYSTKKLEINITNRKITAERSKVMWLNIQWLKFNIMHQYRIFFKYSNNRDVLFEYVDIGKRNSKALMDIELDILYPEGKTISVEKKKDLLELLNYIPPIHHSFYNSIRSSNTVGNTVDDHENDDSE